MQNNFEIAFECEEVLNGLHDESSKGGLMQPFICNQATFLKDSTRREEARLKIENGLLH
jgi:hypothetical protein